MNSITELLNLEDSEIIISDICIQGIRKTLTLETPPSARFCPVCGFKMHSRGIKQRTISHPILQDNYELVLVLKQRRWRCKNPDCRYETNENFKFVNPSRRVTNATDMLIVAAYRDLSASSVAIANKFRVSDTHVLDVFDRYVKIDRLPLTDIISVDEVHLDMDSNCKYALVIQDFYTGEPIDLLSSRRTNVTEPYFVSLPPKERNAVRYLISDMYNPYLAFVDKYFPNAVPVVDSFHVIQWITRANDQYIRQLIKKFRQRDREQKELYVRLNSRNAGKPLEAAIELDELIERYIYCEHEIFRNFGDLLKRYCDPIINSFVMVEKHGPGGIYNSRLSNDPIESLNRKVKDLKRLGRGFRNFEHFRNRFLYATRNNPVLNETSDQTPIFYFDEEE